MNLNTHLQRYIVYIVFFILGSCSPYNKLLKKGSYEEKYKGAKVYYAKGDYYKAGDLLASISTEAVGKPEADSIMYLIAQSLYKQELYYEAADQFRAYIQKYPRSGLVEEAYFLYAKCSYNTSSPVQLDQESTKSAIDALENFMLRYPSSPYANECKDKLNDLYSKLELKALNQVILYYKTGNYKAAVVSSNYFIKDYPESKDLEKVYFTKLSAQFKFGKESLIEFKKDGKVYFLKKDRLNDAKKYYYEYVDKFGAKSNYTTEVEKILKEIDNQLSTL